MERNSADYVREKLWVALEVLATGTGSLQQRLIDADISALMRLEPADFLDIDDASALLQIVGKLTAIEDPEVGSIQATVSRMSDDEAREVAGMIVGLAARVFYLRA